MENQVPMAALDDEFLTVAQAAKLLGVTVPTIYRWRYEHRIPYRKHGRLVRFSKQDLLAWSRNGAVHPIDEKVS